MKIRTSLSLPEELILKLDKQAKLTGLSRSALVTFLLKQQISSVNEDRANPYKQATDRESQQDRADRPDPRQQPEENE